MSTNKPLSDADINQVAGGRGAPKPGANTSAGADTKKGQMSTKPVSKPGDELLDEADLSKVAGGAPSQRSFAVDSGGQKGPKGGTRGPAEPAV